MGIIVKVILICVALGGIGLGNVGLSGDSPESIAVGVLGVVAAFISITFLFKFLWRFLGCLSTILLAVVIVVILLILTGTFDPVVANIKAFFSGSAKVVPASEATVMAEQNVVALPVVQPDGTQTYVNATDNPSGLVTGDFAGSISGVNTGNQFFIDDLKVVLFGVDAPEANQICSDRRGRPYECGQEAIRQLRRFTGSSTLDCKMMGRRGTDGSWVASVCNINNNDLGAAMVSAGWALANPNDTQVYIPYENVAKNNRNGMWAGQFYTPSEWRRRQNIQRQVAKKEESARSSASSGGFLEALGGLFK